MSHRRFQRRKVRFYEPFVEYIHKFFNRVRYFYKRIRNVFAYARYGWREEAFDYDSRFVFDLLLFKFERMERLWRDEKQPFAYTGQDKDAKDLAVMTAVLRRILKADDRIHESPCYRAFEKKYGEVEMYLDESTADESRDVAGTVEWKLTRPDGTVELIDRDSPVSKAFYFAVKEDLKHRELLEKESVDYFMNLFRRKYRKFWL